MKRIITILVFVCLAGSANANFNWGFENTKDTAVKNDSVCNHMYKCFIEKIQHYEKQKMEENEIKLHLDKSK